MHPLIETWWSSLAEFQDLVATLTDEEMRLPTDLPGWDVGAVVSHVAHLEATVAGEPHDGSAAVEVGNPPHVTGMMGVFTEQGVIARRGRTRDQLLAEIATASTRRRAEVEATPPVPEDPAPGVFGMIGWSNALLLKNRPFDIWMHEQDIRRAVGRPGGFDSDGARHVVGHLLASTPFVLGKKAGAAVGESLRLEVAGHDPVTVEIGEDGRGRPASVESPTVTIRLSAEAYVELAGGRRTDAQVVVEGDQELGRRVLANLNVTP